MKLSGGDLLMRALKDEGVKFIFGYPGGANLHIYDSIFKQKAFDHILVDMSKERPMQLMGTQDQLEDQVLYW